VVTRSRRRRPRAATCGAGVLVLSLVVSGCTAEQRQPLPGPSADWSEAPVVEGDPFRAFAPDSWWNTPVPADAPSHPRAADVLRYMSTAEEAAGGCVRLAGAQDSPWGQPVYWASPEDPSYQVTVGKDDPPPELQDLRIPDGAQAADNNDGSMTVFDIDRGYVVALTDAEFDAGSRSWRASGATVTYLDSNGLDARTGGSSDERNRGSHRGNNGAVMMARFDEVSAGRIEHVLKVASGPDPSFRAVFPMVGSDGDSTDPAAPPQGLRFRIKPSVDLDELDLPPQALVIARALQQYGFYIGDSGGVTALKLEDTRSQGRGELWELPADALCELPLSPSFWDVLPEGYQPTG
jgi:hypothetical protein